MRRVWTDFLPEVLSLVALVGGVPIAFWQLILVAVLIRLSLLVSVTVHGLAHALAAGDRIRDRLRGYLHLLSIRGLLPFGPIFVPGTGDPADAPQVSLAGLSSFRCRWVALSGPLANAGMLWLSVMALTIESGRFDVANLALVLFAASNLWIILTSWTDYATALTGWGGSVFCGNFGVLAKRHPRDRGLFPPRFRALAERLGQETDIRGQQAGGIAVLAAGGQFVGHKVVNEKRGNLTQRLLGAFGRRLLIRRLLGTRPMTDLFHLVAHYRYGTSSRPSVIETHWHRWLPPRTERVWSVDGRALVRRRRRVENLITHNGDFDAWEAPGGRLPNAELGAWLGKVLGVGNLADGDSPKIAGMLDLLLTEGQWRASLRLAYALQTGEAIPRQMLTDLTGVFERVFRRWACAAVETRPDPGACPVVVGCRSLADVHGRNPVAVQSLLDELQQASLSVTRGWPEAAKRLRQRIVACAVHAFFHNDLIDATRRFMERAEGTFGLVTTTSLRPGAVALAADRQPLFIGTDPLSGVLLYASEAAALKVVCGEGPDVRLSPLPYRFDLRDGDLVLLQVGEGSAENTLTLVNRYREAPAATERITPESVAASASDHAAGGWIGLCDNPCVEPATVEVSTDPVPDRVLAEMRDIPMVLERVQCEWDDPTSLNRRTARAFSTYLVDRACSRQICHQGPGEPAQNAALDLLVIGVENNHALGQRFVADLRRVFPYLHAEAVDAVSYCDDPRRYAVGPGTVTLAISQSGQTFNTLDAVKFLHALHVLDKAGPVFVMTGEIDTLMGAAVGQGVKCGAPWGERVFATGAGWRTAEPATVSAAATHASLTRLLLHLAREARAACSTDGGPFGLEARDDDLAKLDALARLSVGRASAMVGRTAEGWDIETEERSALLREGHYLSRLLIEPAVVFIVTAVHLFVMLWLGWNPVIGLQEALHGVSGWAGVDPTTHLGDLILVAGETVYFLFFGLAFTLMLRWMQGRPLWDRVFVGRTLVIGDAPHVKDLLAQYVSKLFSLAYEFAGFAGIHAADSRSGELLHGYGHRITRGLLLFLGLPDGRWPGRERAEAAVCMTSSQARGVQSMATGATVIGLGHNPALAAKVDRFVPLGLSARSAETLPWVLRGEWSDLARDLQESRFASFERLIGGYVIFHAAAARTRDFMNRLVPLANLVWAPVFWGLRILTLGRVRVRFGRWDLARTQSGTRIATTASPVPANKLDPCDYLTPAERNGRPAPRLQPVDSGASAPAPLAAPARDGSSDAPCPRRFFHVV